MKTLPEMIAVMQAAADGMKMNPNLKTDQQTNFAISQWDSIGPTNQIFAETKIEKEKYNDSSSYSPQLGSPIADALVLCTLLVCVTFIWMWNTR